jgi:hypothetical protein
MLRDANTKAENKFEGKFLECKVGIRELRILLRLGLTNLAPRRPAEEKSMSGSAENIGHYSKGIAQRQP